MNDIKSLNKRYAAIAWGTLFLWLGILMIIPGNQDPIFVLGAGSILLGLNLARLVSGIPLSAFSITLGCLAFGLGLLAILRPILNIPPFELPFFPTVLIIIGLYVLIPGPKYTEKV
jgi:hypothetical protein